MEAIELVKRLKKQDEKSLTYLYDNFADTLNGIISRIVPSEKCAEEVLSQTFIKILDKIDQYDETKSTLFTWMIQIARNTAIDAKRLNTQQGLQKNETFDTDNQNIKLNLESIDGRHLINNPSKKYRTFLDHIYLNGNNQSQTAEALQIPLVTVKTELRNAMNELRKILTDDKKLFIQAFSLTLIISPLCL